MEPQGFEPRSRPYEWNELAAVLYPCQDHFLRVLPLHQGSVKLIHVISCHTDKLVPPKGIEPLFLRS